MNRKIAVIAILAVSLSIAFITLYYFTVNSVHSRQRHALSASAAESAEGPYWRLAQSCEKRGDLLKSKEIYQGIVEKFPSSGNIIQAQEALESINTRLLFADIETPDSFYYEARKGDGLARIAKKFNTTEELISISNGLKKDEMLRYGRRLKVTKLKFSIAVDKSQNILTLKADGNIFKTYRVSTGKNSSTPVGSFTIINRIIDPSWHTKGKVISPHDPNNVLGSRWMGLSKPSYGIHGTIDPVSIGKSVTDGCVRMKNEDAEELYSIVPEGTEVVIVD